MSETATREIIASEGFWQRHGWKFMLGLVVVIGLFGVGDMVGGLDADPGISIGVTGLTPAELRAESESIARLADLQVRAGGLLLLVVSVLWSVTLWVPFRRRVRWAWYAMWTLPAWAIVVSISFLFVELQPDEPPPPPAISGWVFFALAAGVLLACRRGFFAGSMAGANPPEE